MLRFLVREIYSNVGTKVVAHTESSARDNRKFNMPRNNTAAQQLRKASKTRKTNIGTTWRGAVDDAIAWNGFCYSFGVSTEEGKAEDELVHTLELELVRKRLRWRQDREKYRTLRVLSFSFLSLVILAGLIGFFFFFTRAKDEREQYPIPSPALSPH